MAYERLAQRDPGPVARLQVGAGPVLELRRRGVAAVADRLEHGLAAPAPQVGPHAAYGAELADRLRLAARHLHECDVREDRADRPVLRGRRALAPGAELARDGSRARAKLSHAWQPPPHLVGVALVRYVVEPAALLPRPLEAHRLGEAVPERVRERQQVLHVAPRVVHLLLRQRWVTRKIETTLADRFSNREMF